jgi:acyl carrier protein
MGLDAVELLMRCEEVFEISLEDWRLEHVRTVGDLYGLICEQLQLAPEPDRAVLIGKLHMQRGPLGLLAPELPKSEDVWIRLVDVMVDQLQVDRLDVLPDANIHDDLGCD